MTISVLTIMPELFGSFLQAPVIARAIRNGVLEVKIIDIREYAPGSFRHIDDSPFGGGAGMVMRCQPVLDALRACNNKDRTIILSPAGKPYTQKKAHELSSAGHLVLICGHYEGMDARIYPHADEQISIGDYVLTGGEIAAQVIIDSIARLLPGSLRDESTQEESFENGLLEYPQYTQPALWRGRKVPEVLLSGHHERIRIWRLKESLRETLRFRPDLLEKKPLTGEEARLLEEIREEERSTNGSQSYGTDEADEDAR
jgi:tRNA (guanine37-N1)-methyltransferase